MGGTMSVTNLQLRIPNEATLPVPTTPTRKRKFPSLASPKRSPRRTKHSKVGFIRTGIFPFLFLPGEIRNQIYAHVLLFQDRGRYARDELSGTMRLHQVSTHASPFCASDLMSDEVYYGRRLGIPTAVLRVCKQMHAEAMDVMYQNAFLVDIDYRKAVFSQSSTTVATFWKTDRSVGSPLSIPRQWAVTRITRLHLRIEMHAQGVSFPVQIYKFCYPDMLLMTSLKTMEISVLYTKWSERWSTRRPYKFAEHQDAMAYFRGERMGDEIPDKFKCFVKMLVGVIPKHVRTVQWVDHSEGWRTKNTAQFSEAGAACLGSQPPPVRPMLPRHCEYVKREILEMAASEFDEYRGRELRKYRATLMIAGAPNVGGAD